MARDGYTQTRTFLYSGTDLWKTGDIVSRRRESAMLYERYENWVRKLGTVPNYTVLSGTLLRRSPGRPPNQVAIRLPAMV